VTVESYLQEWLEAGDTVCTARRSYGGYKVTVTTPDGQQWAGCGETILDAMAACDTAMAPHFTRLAGEPAVVI
jgi:hypothetical protein